MAMTRVKVRKEALIERIRAAKAEAKAENEREKEAYADKFAAWLVKVEEILVKTLEKVQKGQDPRSLKKYHGYYLNLPEGPSDPGRFNPAPFDRDIRILEMAADDTISVGTEDRWKRYL
jgi:hypothetical protein